MNAAVHELDLGRLCNYVEHRYAVAFLLKQHGIDLHQLSVHELIVANAVYKPSLAVKVRQHSPSVQLERLFTGLETRIVTAVCIRRALELALELLYIEPDLKLAADFISTVPGNYDAFLNDVVEHLSCTECNVLYHIVRIINEFIRPQHVGQFPNRHKALAVAQKIGKKCAAL